MSIIAEQALELPVSERIQLVTEIWDSIAQDPGRIEISDLTKELLAKRLQEHRDDPEEGASWEEVKDRVSGGG